MAYSVAVPNHSPPLVPTAGSDNHGFSEYQYQLHVVLLSKSKLKSSIRTSTLMAGFALVAVVEVEINRDTPYQILIPFSILTAILIFVHLLSLMLATCLLPELESITNDAHPRMFASALKIAKGLPVQLSWFLSNILGIGLFLLELILVAFVKFYPTPDLENNVYAGVATLITIVILTVLSIPLAVYYVMVVSKHKIGLHEHQLNEAREMLQTINQHLAQPPPETMSINSNGDSNSYHSGAENFTNHTTSSTV